MVKLMGVVYTRPDWASRQDTLFGFEATLFSSLTSTSMDVSPVTAGVSEGTGITLLLVGSAVGPRVGGRIGI